VLALDTKLQITGFKGVASGGMADVVVDPRVLFRSAHLLGVASVIVAHNHPSGDSTPSPEDRALTKQLAACRDMLDLRVRDHWSWVGMSSASASMGSYGEPRERVVRGRDYD